MLALTRHKLSLAQALAGPKQAAEEALYSRLVFKPVVVFREHPDLTIRTVFGLFIPPHQRVMLRQAHLGAQTNVNVSSRGTAKSSTWWVLYANYRALLYPKRKGVMLSAAGFRGGQILFNEAQRMIEGGWDSQEQDLMFLRQAIKNQKIVTRHPNFWEIEYESHSGLSVYPTNDPSKLLGIRGHDLYLDEANTMDVFLIEKVALPFLNVKGDFEHGGANAKKNQVFYSTTIDYNWRDFQKVDASARAALQRDWDAYQAKKRGDRKLYEELETMGLRDTTRVSFDYTDTIIRQHLTTRDGRRIRLKHPNEKLELKRYPRGIPFTTRDAKGDMQLKGPAVMAWMTYPIAKEELEKGIFDGSADESIWKSEQRNITDAAQGDVYAHEIVNRAVCEGARSVPGIPDTYLPPVLWECKDPCVVGVDYAGGNRDFSALVVIRVGPLAEGDFNPKTHHGKTEWSNVIWAEQHRLTSHKDVAQKIRELRERYNLVWHHEPHIEDTWQLCRAIGLDMRGGGQGVRDELVFINDEKPPMRDDGTAYDRIYDPLDKDERVRGFVTDPNAKPMLDAIFPSDQLNDKLVDFTVAQMRPGLLYLPKFLPESLRADRKLDPGYNSAKILEQQLRKLRQEPTKNYRHFFMEGDTNQADKKKDLWAAFIYAAKQARAHILRQRMLDDTPPPMGAVSTSVGKRGLASQRPAGAISW